jgi:undecaprenyl-diphosphatase
MSWLTAVLGADTAAFEFINGTLSNRLFDAVLPWFREKLFWAPLYLFILVFIWYNFPRWFWPLLFGAVLVVALSDSISSRLIKMEVQRIRPCNDPAMAGRVRLRVEGCGAGYSFTSSHASNHFGVAVFLIGALGRVRRWVRPALLAWAGGVALAQVYVGVHYPLDVVAGGLLGAAIGWWTGWAWRLAGWL